MEPIELTKDVEPGTTSDSEIEVAKDESVLENETVPESEQVIAEPQLQLFAVRNGIEFLAKHSDNGGFKLTGVDGNAFHITAKEASEEYDFIEK